MKQFREKCNNKKFNKQEKKANKKLNGLYYSFLTMILFFCLLQIIFSVVMNVSKIVSYHAKILQITKIRDEARVRNEQLQDSIKNFSNIAGLEAIARNNLKMSGEDEVLVIINSQEQQDSKMTENKHTWFGSHND